VIGIWGYGSVNSGDAVCRLPMRHDKIDKVY
jgi:hypothetical protein